MLNHPNIEKKISVNVCKSLNIKKSAFLQIVKMQENLLFTSNPKALILRNPLAEY